MIVKMLNTGWSQSSRLMICRSLDTTNTKPQQRKSMKLHKVEILKYEHLKTVRE